MTAKTATYANQKGGVGKTSTVFHHARSAVNRSLRTLLIDLDPQANLTSVTTAQEFEQDQVGIADVLSDRAPETLRDIIVPGIWEGLSIAPSNGAPLAAVQRELVVSTAGREQRLKIALREVIEDYDLILIDCGPSIDLLTTNALVAADTAVIVSEASLFSLSGLSQMLSSVNEIRSYYNQALTIAGVVVNKHEKTTISGETWRRDLVTGVEAHGIQILEPIIPKRVVIKDSMEAAMGLDQYGSPRTAEMYDRQLNTIINEGARP